MNIQNKLTIKKLFKQAMDYHRSGLYDDAERCYKTVLDVSPGHAEAHFNLGVVAVETRQIGTSLGYFMAALELEPSCDKYWLAYIYALFQSGFVDSARQVLTLARQKGLHGLEIDTLEVSQQFDLRQSLEGGQIALAEALHKVQVADFYYNIEVSGGCNLRCPSCAVGNTFVGGPAKNLMKLDLFRDILHKIRVDHAPHGRNKICIDLYNWGEPLLNSDLPEMVLIAKDRGFVVGISSNLNHVKNLEKLVQACPDHIRISLSGFYQETYARTHKGGDIEVVKANMRLLRALIDKYASPTIVSVGYITYKHNCSNELDLMLALCNELYFKFSKDTAILMPLEKLLGSIESDSVPDKVENLFVITPKLMAEISKPYREKYVDCSLRKNRISINADGSVPLCCAVWSHEFDIAANYLDISLSDIQQARYRHDMCRRCMNSMADFTYNGIYVEPVLKHIRAALS